ncbi:Secreted/periplasmic Zn-dependent peptidase, insulinase [Bradyrhizobium diazoefficiens]|nr:Secreted/periplasmic Zn-dependent peptidase, insulinase [Bradyrhizobium diazoefficiens]
MCLCYRGGSQDYIANAWIFGRWSKIWAANAARNGCDNGRDISWLRRLCCRNNSAIVAISDRGHLCIGVHQPKGMLTPRGKPIHGSCWQAAFASKGGGRNKKQLNRERSIAGRLFSPHAIRMNLLINLREQRVPTVLAQCHCIGESRSHDRTDNQSGKLGDPMIVSGGMQ